MAKFYRDVRNPERYLGFGGQSYGNAPNRKARKPSKSERKRRAVRAIRPPGTTTILRKAR